MVSVGVRGVGVGSLASSAVLMLWATVVAMVI